MSNQPYIYTLPEQFLEDKSVPTHWRLWALINGFFIAGKDFYATNEWVETKLGVKQWAISSAFSKLEELKLISCTRSRNSRVVKAYSSFITSDSDQTLPPQCPTTISDSDSPLHNSVSNSESITCDSEDGIRIEIVPSSLEEDIKVPRPPKYPNAKEVYSWFPFYEKSWLLNTTELKHAELLYERGEAKVRGILKFVGEHKDDDYFPKITKPSDLERKWNDIAEYKV